MATEVLVEAFVDDGRRLLDQLVRDGFEVAAAAWIKSSEEGLWHLYIVSPVVDAERPGEAYTTVFASLSSVSDTSVSISDVRLINDSNPIAQDILGIRDRFPAGASIRFLGKRIGHMPIEEARVYPRRDDSASEALEGLIRFLKEHRRQGLGIDPSIYKRPDGQPFNDEGELIDYWTELLGRMPLQTPTG